MSDEKATHTRDIIHDVNIMENRILELEKSVKEVWDLFKVQNKSHNEMKKKQMLTRTIVIKHGGYIDDQVKEIAELRKNCKTMAILNIDRDNKINRLLAKLEGEKELCLSHPFRDSGGEKEYKKLNPKELYALEYPDEKPPEHIREVKGMNFLSQVCDIVENYTDDHIPTLIRTVLSEKVSEAMRKKDQKSLVSPEYACGEPKNHKTDSKPPEPKLHSLWNIGEKAKGLRDRLPGGTGDEPCSDCEGVYKDDIIRDKACDKRCEEPREDDIRSVMYKGNLYWMPKLDGDVIGVKREDLQFLFDGFAYDGYHEHGDHSQIKEYERLQEAYGIE